MVIALGVVVVDCCTPSSRTLLIVGHDILVFSWFIFWKDFTMIPQRRPLTNRFLHLSPSKPSRTTPGSKRARSPDHGLSQVQHAQKRARPINSTTTTLNPTPRAAKSSNTREKEVRQQQALEFKQKYRQAFCNWKFYFDIAAPLSENMSKLKNDVGKLDGVSSNLFRLYERR